MRRAIQNGDWISFYENNKLVGRVDYSERSQVYRDKACQNWTSGILQPETVLMFADEQLEFDFDVHQGGVENWAKYNA